MGRRPHRHYPEQHQRRQPYFAGDGRPTYHGRHRPRGATDDDVQRRRALEQQRVHHNVEDERPQRKRGRQQVDKRLQHQEPGGRQQESEDGRSLRLYLPRRQRPATRPLHHTIDVAVEVAVHGVSAAGNDCASGHSHQYQPGRGPAALRQDHRRYRGDEQEHNNARLGEAQVSRNGLTQATNPLRCDSALHLPYFPRRSNALGVAPGHGEHQRHPQRRR